MYLARDIVEPACGDHPAFLMGRKGEKVIIRKIYPADEKYAQALYSVESIETNPGKTWWAWEEDMMFTKPM